MSLRNVDLNLMVTLDALLRERHVTRAGQLQGMSQPAMSAALARLRDMFSDELLVRIGQEYQLTPLARDLVAPLQAGLATLKTVLERQNSFDPRNSTREFKIAASDYTLSVLGPKLLRHLAEVAPSVRLHLRVADSVSVGKLANGQLDLSIQPSGVVADLPGEVLFKDSWVCAAWSGNESISDPMTLEEWSSLPHACFSFGCGSIVMTDLLLGPLAEARKRLVISESFLTIPLILPRTRMVAMLPSQIAERFKHSAEIRLVAPPMHIPALSETMTWSSLCELDPAHIWLRQQLRLVAAHDLHAVSEDACELHALRNGNGSLAL